jgi:hypothetical protein
MFCAIKKYSLSQWPLVTGRVPLRWDRRGNACSMVVDPLQGLWSQAGFGGRNSHRERPGALVRLRECLQ